jgi:hypothetical protein
MPINNPGALIRNHKLRGEWAELRFMARAAEHGLMVSRPWGDSAPYDVMVEHRERIHRVQVKCTTHRRGNSYQCHVSANGVPYAKGRLDFIAAYVIPADVWYIIPAAATGAQTHVLLSPHRKNARHARYQEAWHLLLG